MKKIHKMIPQSLFLLGLIAILCAGILIIKERTSAGSANEYPVGRNTTSNLTAPATIFRIVNDKGQELHHKGAELTGDIKVHETDYATGSPADISMKVPSSTGFTYYSGSVEHGYFSVSDPCYFGVGYCAGADWIRIESSRTVTISGSNLDYRVLLRTDNADVYELLNLTGQGDGPIVIQAVDRTIKATGLNGSITCTIEQDFRPVDSISFEANGEPICLDLSEVAEKGIIIR